jgi:hypothetical protein
LCRFHLGLELAPEMVQEGLERGLALAQAALELALVGLEELV